MKSHAASLVALALLVPAAAAAEPYAGLGIGTGAATDGGMSTFDSKGHVSGRLIGGYHFGIVSLEGGFGYIGLQHGTNVWDATSIGIATKLNVPVTPVFEAYVRLGLEKTGIALEDSDGSHDLSASGWTGGLGAQYRLEKISIWADYSKHTMSFKDSRYDGAAAMLTLGVDVAFNAF